MNCTKIGEKDRDGHTCIPRLYGQELCVTYFLLWVLAVSFRLPTTGDDETDPAHLKRKKRLKIYTTIK